MRRDRSKVNFIGAIIWSYLFVFLGQLIGIYFKYFLMISIRTQEIFNIDTKLLSLFLDLFTCIFVILIVVFRIKIYEKRDLNEIKISSEHLLQKYIKGFAIGLLQMTIVTVILATIGAVEIEKLPIQVVGFEAIPQVIFISIGWVIQGASEEFVTRGWMMNVLEKRYNTTFAVILSSSLFGLLHLGNPNINLISIINIILVGLVFSLYVIKTDDLWGACGMHSAWNLAQGNLFGFEVSGINVSIGTLIDLKSKGNDILTGGLFGPEAGIITTFVMIVSIIILFIIIHRDRGYTKSNKYNSKSYGNK